MRLRSGDGLVAEANSQPQDRNADNTVSSTVSSLLLRLGQQLKKITQMRRTTPPWQSHKEKKLDWLLVLSNKQRSELRRELTALKTNVNQTYKTEVNFGG